jgi:hypothetical protein
MFLSRSRLSRVTVVGTIAVGTAIALSSLGIVRAAHAIPDHKSGLFNCSLGTACLEGDSTGSKTWGVYGLSQSADGVHGVTSTTNGNSAVAGISTATSGTGHGVYGVTTVTGGTGVDGYVSDGVGVIGETGSNLASATYPGIFAVGDNKNSWPFMAYNSNTKGICEIDPDADLSCTGTVTGKAPAQTRQRSSNGGDVLSYAAQSASATIEDVGTARMSDGVATVEINRDFASVIDRGWYYVFLTPLGDTRGLYVSEKTPTAFRVRETEHGRSSLLFDYRIVAHPLDAKNDRLPPAPAQRNQAVLPTQ